MEIFFKKDNLDTDRKKVFNFLIKYILVSVNSDWLVSVG